MQDGRGCCGSAPPAPGSLGPGTKINCASSANLGTDCIENELQFQPSKRLLEPICWGGGVVASIEYGISHMLGDTNK